MMMMTRGIAYADLFIIPQPQPHFCVPKHLKLPAAFPVSPNILTPHLETKLLNLVLKKQWKWKCPVNLLAFVQVESLFLIS